MFFGRSDAKAETLVLWPPHAKSWLIGKDSDAGRDLGAVGEGDDRGWDGWMASLTRWTWVNSGSWWWTGRPGMLQFMGPQRVGHDWATKLNWTLDFTTESQCLLHTAVLFHFSVFLVLLLPIFLTAPWLPDLISAPWDQHCFYLQYYSPFLLK